MSQLVLAGPVSCAEGADPVADPTTATHDVVDPPTRRSPSLALVGASSAVRHPSERGLVSAEWAMAIIAAVAIVGVLVAVLTSGPIQAMLTKVIVNVLKKAVTLI
ncbi:MAG: DUF4244 domain-containing protein [Propionibacteriaceae bacterium]